MPKEIIAKNPKTNATYRFIGKEVFLKCNNMQYASQLINQIQQKGGSVKQGRNWLRCDLLGEHTTAKLGAFSVDIHKDTDEEIESKFCLFFASSLKKAGFNVKVREMIEGGDR